MYNLVSVTLRQHTLHVFWFVLQARERERVEEEFRRVEDLSRRLDILEEGMMRR